MYSGTKHDLHVLSKIRLCMALKGKECRLQLAAKSICRGNRSIFPGLEKHERVCQPTMEPDISRSHENTNAGSRCDCGGPSREGSTMVCSPIINAGRLATPPTQTINHAELTQTQRQYPWNSSWPYGAFQGETQWLRTYRPSYKPNPQIMDDKD